MADKIDVKEDFVQNDWFLSFQSIKDLQCYHGLFVLFCLV